MNSMKYSILLVFLLSILSGQRPGDAEVRRGADACYNYEYEQRRQDELREIRLLDPEYVKDFVREYKSLMNESII